MTRLDVRCTEEVFDLWKREYHLARADKLVRTEGAFLQEVLQAYRESRSQRLLQYIT